MILGFLGIHIVIEPCHEKTCLQGFATSWLKPACSDDEIS